MVSKREMSRCGLRVAALGMVMAVGVSGAWGQGLSLLSAGRMGGSGSQRGTQVTADAQGNSYVVGELAGSMDVDPGPGVVMMTAIGPVDSLVTKINAAGNLVWARQFGGPAAFMATAGVTTDSQGSVFVTGSWEAVADFDPSPAVFNMTPLGPTDTFVVKLDSAGSFVWARQAGGGNFTVATGIHVDGTGNVTVAGLFEATADFDPSAGVSNLTAFGAADGFVWRLNGMGNLAWVRQLGGAMNDELYGSAIDASGNVYVIGSFEGTGDFDPGPGTTNLTAPGTNATFVAKLNGAGNLTWARMFGGADTTVGRGVAVDSTGNVITTGAFSGTSDFDPSPGTSSLTSAGQNDQFVSKLSASGGFLWAVRMPGTGDADARDVAVDAADNILTTGFFEGTADFDPGAGTWQLVAFGFRAGFVSSLDGAGQFLWAEAFAGSGNTEGNALSVGSSGRVHTTGFFSGTAEFAPFPCVYNLTSLGAEDTFIATFAAPTLAFSAFTSGGGTGDLSLEVADIPANATHVWLLGSATPASGQGPVFGLVSDALFTALLGYQPQPLSVIHFPVTGNPYAAGPVNLPAGTVSGLGGLTWELKAFAYRAAPFAIVGQSCVVTVEW